LNIVLDPIFIFVFKLGVQGAAIATVISQTVTFIYIFSQAQSDKSELRLNLKEWLDIDLQTIKEIFKIGFPTFIRNSIGAILMVIVFQVLKTYVDTNLELYQSMYALINRIIMFILFPAFGVVQGLNPIAGFNFGAKKYQRLYDVIIFATTIVISYFTIMFILIHLFSPALFSLFSPNNDQFFITEGAKIFRIITLGFFVIGFQIILGSVYQSFGYPVRAMLVALSRQFLLFIPIALILINIFKLDGLWYTFASADILSGLLSLVAMAYELKIIKRKALGTV